MKKLFCFLMAITLLVTPSFATVIIPGQTGNPAVAQIIETPNSEVGLGRIAHTLEKMGHGQVTTTAIRRYENDPSKWVVTCKSDNSWSNGEWLVWLVNEEKEPNRNGYWYNIYGPKYEVKYGIANAIKLWDASMKK